MKRLITAVVLAVLGLLCPASSGSAQDSNADNTRPDLKLWSVLKRSLTGADGEEFFLQKMKDCVLPAMAGTLISSTPAEQPTVLVIGLSDSSSPEITLRLKDGTGRDAPFTRPIARGSQIRFEGIVTEFSKDPFMLTIETSSNLGNLRRP